MLTLKGGSAVGQKIVKGPQSKWRKLLHRSWKQRSMRSPKPHENPEGCGRMDAEEQSRQGCFKELGGYVVMAPEGIAIDETSILRIQGYRDLERIRPAIKRAAMASARETEDLIRPRAYYRILNVDSCEGSSLELEDGTVFENEAFQRFLKKPRSVVAFVSTMGHALDQAVVDYIADDQLLNALFLETAGWLGIEAATRTLSIHLRSQARERGLRLSPRLGPGYSYKLDGRSVLWPLEQQQTLFKLFANASMDVELLESCAMLPKISRSGIYGFLEIPKA